MFHAIFRKIFKLKTHGEHIRAVVFIELMMGIENPENITTLAFTVSWLEPHEWSK